MWKIVYQCWKSDDKAVSCKQITEGFEHHRCCKSWFKKSFYCIGFHDRQTHNELMIKNSKMYIRFVAPPWYHDQELKFPLISNDSVNGDKNKWHDNTTECTLRYILKKIHLALDDLGSDFWTGSRYSKYKKCASLGVYSKFVQSESATVYT